MKTQLADWPLKADAKIVAYIPALNEERAIAKVTTKAMRRVDQVLVCNDGSSEAIGGVRRNSCASWCTL